MLSHVCFSAMIFPRNSSPRSAKTSAAFPLESDRHAAIVKVHLLFKNLGILRAVPLNSAPGKFQPVLVSLFPVTCRAMRITFHEMSVREEHRSYHHFADHFASILSSSPISRASFHIILLDHTSPFPICSVHARDVCSANSSFLSDFCDLTSRLTPVRYNFQLKTMRR